MPNFLLGFLTNNKKGENEMKKNLMFFALGVSTTLLMGAGISYWNQIYQANKYGVLVDSLGYGTDVPYNNKYGVLVNSLGYGTDVPYNNKYALVLDGEIGNDAKKAMVVGFIHGMAVGRKKAKEEAAPRNQNYQRTRYGF